MSGLTQSHTLGVKITRRLCWSDHISSAAAKANRILSLLRRSMYGCSKEVKKRAYVALVRPHLEYCSPVWNPHLKKDCDKLERVQKRAARWAYCQWDRHTYTWSHTYEEACKHLKLKTLESRRRMLLLCQVYKIIHNLDCILLILTLHKLYQISPLFSCVSFVPDKQF